MSLRRPHKTRRAGRLLLLVLEVVARGKEVVGWSTWFSGRFNALMKVGVDIVQGEFGGRS